MIFKRISDDIPPQMKILNMIIPTVMHFCSFVLIWSVASPIKPQVIKTKCDVIDDVKLFPTVYQRIYCRKLLTLSNQTSRYKIKCIRMFLLLMMMMLMMMLIMLMLIMIMLMMILLLLLMILVKKGLLLIMVLLIMMMKKMIPYIPLV